MEQKKDQVFEDGALVSETIIPWTWGEIRALRNQKLEEADNEQRKAFDYWMLSGQGTGLEFPAWVKIGQWAQYCQALRNIPEDFESPDDVKFPAKPE